MLNPLAAQGNPVAATEAIPGILTLAGYIALAAAPLLLLGLWYYRRLANRRRQQIEAELLRQRHVRHDMANLILAIQLQLRELAADPLREARWPEVFGAIDHLAALCDELTAGDLQQTRSRRMRLRVLVEQVVASNQAYARSRDVTLRLINQVPLGAETGESTSVLRVLENLLGNAIRLTPAAGTVTVRAVARAPNMELSIGEESPGAVAQARAPASNDDSENANDQQSLEIVHELLEEIGGGIEISPGPAQRGTQVNLRIPFEMANTRFKPDSVGRSASGGR